MGVIRGMPNWKAVGPDSFPAQVLSSTTLSLSGTFIIYLSMCGEREKFPNSGKMRPSNSSIKRRIALTATTTEGFRLLPTQAKYCRKWSRPASATTARPRGYSQKSSTGFAQHVRQSTCCSSCADYQNSDERGESSCTCASSTSRNLRLRRPRAVMGCACTLRCTREDVNGSPPVP